MTDPRDSDAPAGEDHPGFHNYRPAGSNDNRPTGSDPGVPRRVADSPTTRVTGRRTPLPPLHPVTPPPGSTKRHPKAPRMPRKLTVTRVAAMRSRELTGKGIASFQRAAKADGADKSGLTALTYATMANFASDAALAVALANTLFFSAAAGEDKIKVALYLLITIAPFAVIAPLIGPMLDRFQHGRRVALATSFLLRTVLAVVLVFNFDSWVLYPAALGMLVLSKSFAVLKSAVTPRVLPPEIDLVRVNSRLTVFGLLGGTIVAGGIAALIAFVADSPGALWFVAIITVFGAYLSMRIPSWVEVTEGEVPATLSYHGEDTAVTVVAREIRATAPPKNRRQPLGKAVITALWGNGTIRVLTGFLTLYVAFVAKAQTDHEPVKQAAMLGLVGAAAAIGNFAGNATGARQTCHRHPPVHRRRDCRHHRRRPHRQSADSGSGSAGGLVRERAGQGLARRVVAVRSTTGVDRLGIRTIGNCVATVLGSRRNSGRTAPHRVLARLHRRVGGADPRTRPDVPDLPRQDPATRVRRQSTRARRPRNYR